MFFQIKIIAKNDRVPSLKIEDDLQEELLTKLKSSTVFENHPKGRIRVFLISAFSTNFCSTKIDRKLQLFKNSLQT